MGIGKQVVVVAGRRCGRLCHHRMPLPPPRVTPLLPAAAAISARACISVQPRVLVPGQREGMEASLYRLLPNAHRKSLPRSCVCVFVAARV